MAGSLEMEFNATDAVEYRDVRSALRALGDDDVSKTSPVSGGAHEVGVEIRPDGDTPRVRIAVTGHGGEFTKKTTAALRETLLDVEGIEEVHSVEGGHESEDGTGSGTIGAETESAAAVEDAPAHADGDSE